MKLLFIDFSTGVNSVNDLINKPRGGIVNSLHILPDELVKLGHQCYVLSDVSLSGETLGGTEWHNQITFYEEHIHEHTFDILILNRGIGKTYQNIKAKRRILWAHDLPHAGFIPDPDDMKKIDATVFMSGYAEHIWRTFYKTIGKSFYIPNGVDPVFKETSDTQRNYERLIYASHPNRGLKRMPFIHDCVGTRINNSLFHTCTYSSKSIYRDDMNIDDESVSMDYSKAEFRGYFEREPVGAEHLSSIFREAGLMVLPSGFPEICSNTVLQALASGLPIVTTGYMGATREWVQHKHNGMLTQFQPNDYMVFQVEIIRHVVDVLQNRRLHQRLIKNARKTRIYTWREIAKQWHKMFKRIG